jgi:hypothetical protein
LLFLGGISSKLSETITIKLYAHPTESGWAYSICLFWNSGSPEFQNSALLPLPFRSITRSALIFGTHVELEWKVRCPKKIYSVYLRPNLGHFQKFNNCNIFLRVYNLVKFNSAALIFGTHVELGWKVCHAKQPLRSTLNL